MAKLTLARIVFLRMFRWLVDKKGSFSVKNLTENRTKKRAVSQQVDENTVGGFTNNIDFFQVGSDNYLCCGLAFSWADFAYLL